MCVIGYDEGGSVDTLAFNRQRHPCCMAERQHYQQLLHRLTQAIYHQDCQTIGQVATFSALLNQKNKKNKTLPMLLNLCQQHQGLGISIAHSGTYIGILLDQGAPQFTEQQAQISDTLIAKGLRPMCFTVFSRQEHSKPC